MKTLSLTIHGNSLQQITEYWRGLFANGACFDKDFELVGAILYHGKDIAINHFPGMADQHGDERYSGMECVEAAYASKIPTEW